MVSVDCHRNSIPLLTPDGVDCISTCCPHCLASRTQKSPPFGLGDCARKASFSPKGDAHSDGESYPRARGTRHERNFFEKASYKLWDFTIASTAFSNHLLEEPGHNDRDFLAQWKQIKDAQSLNDKSLTTCSAHQIRPTAGRTQQPKLQKCSNIHPYIMFPSHSPPTFQMESHRLLYRTITKDPNATFPSFDSPLSLLVLL